MVIDLPDNAPEDGSPRPVPPRQATAVLPWQNEDFELLRDRAWGIASFWPSVWIVMFTGRLCGLSGPIDLRVAKSFRNNVIMRATGGLCFALMMPAALFGVMFLGECLIAVLIWAVWLIYMTFAAGLLFRSKNLNKTSQDLASAYSCYSCAHLAAFMPVTAPCALAGIILFPFRMADPASLMPLTQHLSTYLVIINLIFTALFIDWVISLGIGQRVFLQRRRSVTIAATAVMILLTFLLPAAILGICAEFHVLDKLLREIS